MRPHIRPSHLSIRHLHSPVARPGVLRDVRLLAWKRDKNVFEDDPVLSN